MTSRTRIRRVLALAVALLLLGSAAAWADRATFDRVSNAYANNGGQLDACSFSQADLGVGAGRDPARVRRRRAAAQRGDRERDRGAQSGRLQRDRADRRRRRARDGDDPAAGTGTTTPAAGGATTPDTGAGATRR